MNKNCDDCEVEGVVVQSDNWELTGNQFNLRNPSREKGEPVYITLTTDPFLEEIYDDHTLRYMCGECISESYMDI